MAVFPDAGLCCRGIEDYEDIPLIVDNAYGAPFPNILFEDVKPDWNENTIFCMNLSKLGLPAARTGIVIARKEVIEMVSKVNAILSLALGGMGPAIATNMVQSTRLCRRQADRRLSIMLQGP